MKCVVTGGAGFIGSNLAAELVRQGHSVTVVDNLATGNIKNLDPIKKQIKFAKISILDQKGLKKTFAGMDVVFHQAAIPSVPKSVADPHSSNEANITGTLNVLIAARDAKVKRVVYAASSSAYGNANVEWKVETLPANPLSPYALQKYVGEVYCRQFYELYGLETVCLRYFNVYGPYQDPKSTYAAVIPKFITCVLKGESPDIYGDGKQSRDFTFVANNVHANILAATNPNVVGQTFNIALGESISLNDLLKKVNKMLGKDVKANYLPERKGDVKHSKANIKKANSLLGYKPIVNFDDGLIKTIDWYKQQQRMK